MGTTATPDATVQNDAAQGTVTVKDAPKGPRDTNLTVTAPTGAHFEMEEVHTAKGSSSLGEVPILVWDNAQAALATYGEEGVKDILDGTSLRVSFQNIARRFCIAGKSNDDIAKAQVDFRPGRRSVAAATPKSRAAKAAGAAAEKLQNPDLLTNLMQQIAEGKLSEADLAALTGTQA